MFPPSTNTSLDIEALSGICGSISIACWVVVFSPQIIENFRRRSADGLSIVFIVIWLAGDVFNILGAIMQGVLPTMIILAIYYTLADIVLLGQVFYYRGFTLKDVVKKPAAKVNADEERRPLLANGHEHGNGSATPSSAHEAFEDRSRRRSFTEEVRRHLSMAGAEHLSPATPLLDAPRPTDPAPATIAKPTTTLQSFIFNSFAIILVCAAGVFGWWISSRHSNKHHHHSSDDNDTIPSEPLQFDTFGQIFGYFCALLYLGSRIPQLLLNYRRKSTEGVSLLFFLFACIGNLTYDMSIFAYNPEPSCRHGIGHCEPGEARQIYARYIAVNASWIAGSLGTLFLDMAIFVQFFLYQKDDDESAAVENGRAADGPIILIDEDN